MEARMFESDRPIDGSKSRPDLLHRSEFSRAIAEQICPTNRSPGVTVGIEAPWGYGKSSALLQVEQALRERPADDWPYFVKFNPWAIGSFSDLARDFFVEMGRGISRSAHKDRAAQAAKIVRLMGSFAELAALAIDPTGTVGKATKGALTGTAEAIEGVSTDTISALREKVEAETEKLGIPIVVFIDDLDRLPPDELYAMIRLIKGVSDFRFVTYVLAYDREYINLALADKGIPHPDRYLDKIIQVRLQLPVARLSDLTDIAGIRWGDFITDEHLSNFPDDAGQFRSLFHYPIKHALSSVREINGIANRLRLLPPAVSANVRFSQFFGLETLAITAPRIYEHIRTHPFAWTGTKGVPFGEVFPPTSDDEKDDAAAHLKGLDSLLAELPARVRAPIRYLCEHLFPRTSPYPHVAGQPAPPRHFGTIANPINLRIALAASQEQEETALADVQEFIREPEQRLKIEAALAGHGDELLNFLDVCDGVIRSEELEEPEGFIHSIARLVSSDSALAIAKARGGSLFERTPAEAALRVIIPVLRSEFDPESAHEPLSGILSDAACGIMSAEIAFEIAVQKKSNWEDEHQGAWISDDGIDTLIAMWTPFALAALRSKENDLPVSAARRMFIGLLESDATALQELVSDALVDVDLLDRIAPAMANRGEDSIGGAFVSMKEEYLVRLGDPSQIRAVAKLQLDRPDLTTELRAIYSCVENIDTRYLAGATPVED